MIPSEVTLHLYKQKIHDVSSAYVQTFADSEVAELEPCFKNRTNEKNLVLELRVVHTLFLFMSAHHV